jgi:hypothetical protein
MTDITAAEPGMCITFSATMNGEYPTGNVLQGTTAMTTAMLST